MIVNGLSQLWNSRTDFQMKRISCSQNNKMIHFVPVVATKWKKLGHTIFGCKESLLVEHLWWEDRQPLMLVKPEWKNSISGHVHWSSLLVPKHRLFSKQNNRRLLHMLQTYRPPRAIISKKVRGQKTAVCARDKQGLFTARGSAEELHALSVAGPEGGTRGMDPIPSYPTTPRNCGSLTLIPAKIMQFSPKQMEGKVLGKKCK